CLTLRRVCRLCARRSECGFHIKHWRAPGLGTRRPRAEPVRHHRSHQPGVPEERRVEEVGESRMRMRTMKHVLMAASITWCLTLAGVAHAQAPAPAPAPEPAASAAA